MLVVRARQDYFSVILAWGVFVGGASATMGQGAARPEGDAATSSANRQMGNFAIGVTRAGTAIPCLVTSADLDLQSPKTRVLLVGGLDADERSSRQVAEAWTWFAKAPEAKSLRERFSLAAVPQVYPDRVNDRPPSIFPPGGEYYTSVGVPEDQYLWRWIGMYAPDAVLVWTVSSPTGRPTSFVEALEKKLPPCDVGSIPGRVVICGEAAPAEALAKWLAEVAALPLAVSPARKELQGRLDRTPRQVAEQLALVYGHELNSLSYLPAVALLGRLRLGELTGDATQRADVQRIVAPYLDGEKHSLTPKSSNSEVAGHILFGALVDATGERAYLPLARAAADRGFDAQGKPLPNMPGHSEMSDAVFMGCPILAQVGRLTGESKYFDQCLRHMRFMNQLNLRPDGLHRHSPLDATAWGRGNGFPALGLALVLTDLPASFSGREAVLAAHRDHLRALLKHQDATGCWHQVVDRPESYRELTSTCMITFALARGIGRGWLDRNEFEPAMRRGWYAIRTRVAADGRLVDVCTGTGKQKSLRDYYDRPAILGRDPRGGAMALLVATEMMAIDARR